MVMANGTEEAEKAFRSAEERFLDGALRVSRNAKRHLASLPALQSALAAYEVHAAARGGRNCWYAVLGVCGGGGGKPEPVTHDHDAIKKRYSRLCLVLHPDKNHSAAADGAFKLLQRAWEVLSARHPPGSGTGPDPGTAAGRSAQRRQVVLVLPQIAAAAARSNRPRLVVVALPLQAAARAHLVVVRLHAAAAALLVVGVVLGQLQRVAVQVRAQQKGHCLLRALRLEAGVGVGVRRRGRRRARRQVPLVRHPLQAPPRSLRHAILLRRRGGHDVTTTGRSSSRAPPSAPGAKRPSRRWCPPGCASSGAGHAPTTPSSTCTTATGPSLSEASPSPPSICHLFALQRIRDCACACVSLAGVATTARRMNDLTFATAAWIKQAFLGRRLCGTPVKVLWRLSQNFGMRLMESSVKRPLGIDC